MPRLNRNNSSNEGGNSGKGRAVAKGMKGIKLAKRLPHLSSLVDATLSSRPGFFGGSKSGTNITSTGSQTYTVPQGVDTLTITMYGGGAGGGLAASGRGGTVKGGGGGGGARLVITLNEVKPGETLTFNVGAGGAKSTSTNGVSSNGGDTTFSYDGKDYVAGGGEGNRSGSLGIATKDGTGGAGDCDGGSTCTATAGNNGTAYNTGASTTPGGNSLETSNSSGAGAGGIGSNNASSQNAADGQNGKVVIS